MRQMMKHPFSGDLAVRRIKGGFRWRETALSIRLYLRPVSFFLTALALGLATLFLLVKPHALVSAQDTGRLISDLDWSPDGQHVALGIARWQQGEWFGGPYLACEPVFGIYLVEAATQTVEFIDLNIGCSPSTVDFNPTGAEIVFTSNAIYGAIDLAARATRQQVVGGAFYQSVFWHPNGDSALLTLDVGVGAIAYNMIDGVPNSGFDERNFPGLLLPFVYSIWSPDGNRAASSTADGKIYAWQNGQVQQVFAQHSAPVRRFVWNAATNLIASGDDSGRIFVWNPSTGETVRELAGHIGAILDIDWRADGQQIVSTSLDNTMRAWDWPSGEGRIVEQGRLTSAVAYSPDGTELAYGGEVTDLNNVQINIIPVVSLGSPTPTPTFTLTATATASPTPTPAPLQRIRLTSLCSDNPDTYRVSRVRNPNPREVVVTWDVYRTATGQNGFVIAPPAQGSTPGEVTFITQTEAGPNTVRIFVDGVQQDVKASTTARC
jgi:hypothetical protein